MFLENHAIYGCRHAVASARRWPRRSAMLMAGVAAVFGTMPAFAQASAGPVAGTTQASSGADPQPAATPPAPDAAIQAGEIVVTATRRSEALSKVPVAITAFDGPSLAKHTVVKETDLQSIVPGLTIKATGSQNQLNYAIRGQTLDAFSGSSAGVLAYVNDVQVSSQTASALFDLSSVQVLKGPQGTLFGRNAVGGAVLYNTTMPGDRFAGFVTVRLGDYDLHQYTAAIDIPLKPDILSIRLAGDIDRQHGYVTNLYDGGRLGDTDARSFRISVKFTPTEGLKDTLVYQYGKYGGTNIVGELRSVYPVGSTNNGYALNTTAAALYGQAILNYVGQQQAQGPYIASLPYKTPQFRSQTNYIENTLSYEFNSNLQIKNILSYSRSSPHTGELLSGSPYGVLDLIDPATGEGPFFGIRQKSGELQLLGHTLGGHLQYIVGGYIAREKDINIVPDTVGFNFTPPVLHFNLNYNTVDQTKATYAQATYDLSDLTSLHGLSVTGGFRYTWEDLSLIHTAGSTYFGNPKQNASESKPSWTASIQWQANPQTLFYFANRGSWRSGNFNGTTSPVANQDQFFAETTHDFELGAKFSGLVAGHRAHLNVALYDQITHNVQRDVYVSDNGVPLSFTHNVPEAEVKGVELDADFQPVPWLTIGGNGAYTHAKYTKPTLTEFGQTITFQIFQDTPRLSGTVFADVTLPAPAAWGPLSLHVDAYSQAHTYFSSLATSVAPGTRLPAYTLINTRIDWKKMFGSQISSAFFMKNIGSEHYYFGGYALGPAVGFNTALPAAPRQYGFELNFSF